MTLGFLSFIPLVGAIAFVLGASARVSIEQSKGRLAGREMARAGMWLGGGATVGYVVLVTALFAMGWRAFMLEESEHGCNINLRHIGLGMLMYENDYPGVFPPSLGVLLDEGYVKGAPFFQCPFAMETLPPVSRETVETATHYVYVRPAGKPSTPIPMAWDRVAAHHDGRVSVLDSSGKV